MASLIPSGFFVLRTPLLPFDELLAWSEGIQATGALNNPKQLEQALAQDRRRLRARLAEIVSRPEIREALFLASPHLEEVVDVWLSQPDTEQAQGIERALVRYFVRMVGRCTPFGLCAGSCVGAVQDKTSLVLGGQSDRERHTRLGMDYLFSLTEALQRDPVLRSAITYGPNTSLYRAAGNVRYVESRSKDNERSYHLVAVAETEAMHTALGCAAKGAAFEDLVQALVDQETTIEEARDYIADLVANGILVADNTLPVTGREPVNSLIDRLRDHSETTFIAKQLDQTCASLAAMDADDEAVAPARYREVAEMLRPLPGPVKLEHLFQVDMMPNGSRSTLGSKVVTEIVRGVDLLHGISKAGNDQLNRFRLAFRQRFESREVMLLEALDEERGIPFGTAYETTATLAGAHISAVDETTPWTARDKLLLRKLSDALKTGAHEIVLTAVDLEKMAAAILPLPDAFSVQAAIAASSEEALSEGNFRVMIDAVAGPSGAHGMGRFCYADAELQRHVKAHLRTEELLQPDALFAEIVSLPEGHFGNVVCRPILRDYEIPYLGSAGVDASHQLPPADLTVSLVGDRFVLRSVRLDREVMPRVTTAYIAGASSLGVYRFLSALQGQGVACHLSWDWGVLLDAPFLPRVTAGRLILCRAQWRLTKEEITRLSVKHDASLYRHVQSWRSEAHLPRWIAVVEDDNVLPVDLDNILSVETFAHLIRNRDEAILVELFPGPDELCAHGRAGKFFHELIVPFTRARQAAEDPGVSGGEDGVPKTRHVHPREPSSTIAGSRSFPPGSEWLYAKLYTGTDTADQLLCATIAPLVREVISGQGARGWFFLRYADPDHHLRLRFCGDPKRLHRDVLPLLQEAFSQSMKSGRIWRAQLDTYEREVERYGGSEGVDLAERIAHVDSDAVISILSLLEPGDEGLDERWRLSLAGIDKLLMDFGFDVQARGDLIKQLPASLRVKRTSRTELSEKFRRERESLETLLRIGSAPDHELAPGLDILHKRSERLAPIIAEVKALTRTVQLSVSLGSFAMSCAHMFANRLLRAAHAEQEPVIYDFLSRLYRSEGAQAAEK